MALSASILAQIRNEIGDDTELDVADDATIEAIYVDVDQGNFSILNTAYLVWKKRLTNYQSRSFDVATAGELLSRSQRVKFLQGRVNELRLLVDTTKRASVVLPALEQEVTAEFS